MNEHMQRHIDDVRRLVTIFAARGRVITERDAYEAWSAYSESSAAGWLVLGDDDDVLHSWVENYLPSAPATP